MRFVVCGLLKNYSFIFICAGSALPRRLLSSCRAWGLLSSHGALLRGDVSCCGARALGHTGFSGCGSGFYSWGIFFSFIFISWRLITLQYCSGSRVLKRRLNRYMGLVAPWLVASSWIRA